MQKQHIKLFLLSTLTYLILAAQPVWAGYILKAIPEAKTEAALSFNQAIDHLKKAEFAKAEAALQKAAEAGIADAQFDLALLHHQGDAVAKSYVKAAEWYRKAAEQGHIAAQNNLAILYRDATGVDFDFDQAKTWFSKAAEQGYAEAQNNLGQLYLFGKQRDIQLAKQWFNKAATQGNFAASYNLWVLYTDNKASSEEFNSLIVLMEKSAKNGNVNTQSFLANVYYEGAHVTQNLDKAIYWYRKAAEKGDFTAQYNLGQLYYYGQGGLSKDLVKAYRCLTLSMKNGFSEAIELRDEVKSKMTPEQIEQAEKLVQEWLRLYGKNKEV
jgi:hypothetical protein